jgi:hypothetical protein
MHKAASTVLRCDTDGLIHTIGRRLNADDNASGLQLLDMPIQHPLFHVAEEKCADALKELHALVTTNSRDLAKATAL